MGKEDAVPSLKDTYPVQYPDIKIPPITETEIKCITLALNTNN
jgi:hypothetical protein